MVFGEVADVYHDVRPGYPEELIDDAVAFAGLADGGTVLEVGAGTGKATVAFAARGLEIVALEPSGAMAAIARRTCAPPANVRIEPTTFEGWTPPVDRRFDAVISAQAWHWVAPEVSYRKAHRVLKPAGALALFWNRPARSVSRVRADIDAVYARCAPALGAREPGHPGARVWRSDSQRAAEIGASRLFGEVHRREYRWSERYPTERYTRLLCTQSDHRMLGERDRARLLASVGDVLDRHGGGITVEYTTALFLAQAVTGN